MNDEHVDGVTRTFPKKGNNFSKTPKSERLAVIKKSRHSESSKRKAIRFCDEMPAVKSKAKLSKKKKFLKKQKFQEKLEVKYGSGVEHAAIVSKKVKSQKKHDVELTQQLGNKYGSVEHKMLGGDSDDMYSDVDVADMLEKDSNNETKGIPIVNKMMNKISALKGIPLDIDDLNQEDREHEIEDNEMIFSKAAMDLDDSSEDDFERNIHSKEKNASQYVSSNPSDSDVDDRPDEEEMVSEEFRAQLANLPLREVRKVKEKLGIKLFNKAYFGSTEEEHKMEQEKKQQKMERKFKRENANRPREMSSKVPVSRLRNVYANEKKTRRSGFDPRFDERCGAYDETIYNDSYSFLRDMRAKEKEMLRKGASVARIAGDIRKAERMRELFKKMENQDKNKKVVEMKRQTIHELKKENMERMKQGLAPVFKTKAQVRERNMEKKFNQLKADHGVDKYLVRQSKKQLVKERKEGKKPSMSNEGE